MKQLFLFLFVTLTFSSFGQNYQFLGSYTADGTPLYFETSDIITPQTVTLVRNSLPENYPVPTYNPQYISSGYDTDLIIDSLADVWVTFISEGAGFKNVLGFYTYDLNNPPTVAPTAEQITIIFPNVSGLGSGGSLVAGHKVKLGTFSAGTGIGWVLLANAWNGSQVTNGLWRLFSNPNFNPEANPSLRNHNVLLNDPDNERIILGFEDIRRDYSNCDQDFNDAVFYISANPFTALRTQNVADISSATPISSGNNGGLESEGSLATLIAKRNFKRVKENSFADSKSLQSTFASTYKLQNAALNSSNLENYFPTTGMFGTETASISSPTDLIGITNAIEVFSVDYYQDSNRVAAALGTKTTGQIYNHTKVICDRLNNSSLEDIRTVLLQGYEIIMAKLKRDNGDVEYALNFSIQELGNSNKIHSYWNIGQYPAGNYTNFQIWGATMGQVSSVANHILQQYIQQNPLIQDEIVNRIPTVFVKKGNYKDGKISLTLVNKTGATSLNFNGNKKITELGNIVNTTFSNSISSAYQSEIEMDMDNLFDIGFTIAGNNSPQQDALYLADGPWGIDFLEEETNITTFQITNPTTTSQTGVYTIERNASVIGEVKGTANLFRNILPGELLFDASNYQSVQFKMQSNVAVEVILVTENTSDWNNRLRIQIPANTNLTQYNITFNDFTSPNGTVFQNEKIRGFVFSIVGDYAQFQPFALQVNDMKLSSDSNLNTAENTFAKPNTMYNYPNPFSTETTIVLNEIASSATVQLIDVTGRIVQQNNYVLNGNSEIKFTNQNAPKGMYILQVTTDANHQYQQKVIIK
jgi:hypothetical protein